MSSSPPQLPLSSPLFPYTTLFRSWTPVLRRSSIDPAEGGRFLPPSNTGNGEKRRQQGVIASFPVPGEESKKNERAWSSPLTDRKSTRLNSSHRCISYAVFCLKKIK